MIDGKEHAYKYDLLAAACESESNKDAWELMRIANHHPAYGTDKTFTILYDAVAIAITWKFKV